MGVTTNTISKYQTLLNTLEGQIDYQIIGNLPEFERIHLKAILDHIHALTEGKNYLFKCLDCKFNSNSGKQAAIHRNDTKHRLIGPPGWFCICGSTGTNPITFNKHMKYYCRAFRFDENTLKVGEASNIAFNLVKSLNFKEKYKFSQNFKEHLNEIRIKGLIYENQK